MLTCDVTVFLEAEVDEAQREFMEQKLARPVRVLNQVTMTSTTEFLTTLLGPDRVVVLDGECVDHVGLYESVLAELIRRVSSGGLTVRGFAGVEGPVRRLTLALGDGAPHTFEVEGDTDWLDGPAVVGGINHLLEARGDERQLVEYHGDEFGQESGWVLVSRDELRGLLEFGLFEDPTLRLTFGTATQLTPVSEDRGGDGPGPWEDALLELSST